MKKKRLDVLMTERGLTESREKARRMIMAGQVAVDGKRLDKPGAPVSAEAALTVRRSEDDYVSRGGAKLAGAIEAFGVEVRGKVALDVGASTGGFTDCLLRHGAAKVYAVDVGHGQIDSRLRRDDRIVVLERENIRYLSRDKIPEPADLATVDTSFISLKLVLPRVAEFVRPGGEILALIKPQFELGPKEVGKGVVRDPAKHDRAVAEVSAFAQYQGYSVLGVRPSPITGAKGNLEFFIYLKTGERHGRIAT